VRTPAGHLPSPPMVAAHLFPEPAAGEPYTILIMCVIRECIRSILIENSHLGARLCRLCCLYGLCCSTPW
jgi:hypothetical protein